MLKDIRKVIERNKELFILNKDGVVVRFSIKQKENFHKFAHKVNLPKNPPKIIKELADIGLLEFKNYNAKNRKMNFDDILIRAHGIKPAYSAPIIAHLSITPRCNMGCRYCSVRKIHKKQSEGLITKDYKRIIDKLAEWGIFQIGLTGGEPTLRKDILELTAYIASYGIACNMTTNGWNVSMHKAHELYKAGMEQAQVSLDSHIKEHHEQFRNKGSFEKALRTIEVLKKAGMKVGVDCVVSKNNVRDIPKFVKFLEEKGVPGLTLIKLKKGDLPIQLFKSMIPEYREYGEIIAMLCERNNKMPEVTIDCGSVSNLHYSLTVEEQKRLHSAGCPAGHTLISIAPNGDVYPCAALADKKFKLGNILDNELREIWQDNEMLQKLRDIKANVTGQCKYCTRLDSCRGGCRGIAEILSDIYASDATCTRKEVIKND